MAKKHLHDVIKYEYKYMNLFNNNIDILNDYGSQGFRIVKTFNKVEELAVPKEDGTRFKEITVCILERAYENV